MKPALLPRHIGPARAQKCVCRREWMRVARQAPFGRISIRKETYRRRLGYRGATDWPRTKKTAWRQQETVVSPFNHSWKDPLRARFFRTVRRRRAAARQTKEMMAAFFLVCAAAGGAASVGSFMLRGRRANDAATQGEGRAQPPCEPFCSTTTTTTLRAGGCGPAGASPSPRRRPWDPQPPAAPPAAWGRKSRGLPRGFGPLAKYRDNWSWSRWRRLATAHHPPSIHESQHATCGGRSG